MKIICTQEEKEQFVLCVEASDTCPVVGGVCKYGELDGGCRECIESNIEWQIEDGENE